MQNFSIFNVHQSLVTVNVLFDEADRGLGLGMKKKT